MEDVKNKLALNNEILLLRQKLDSILSDETASTTEVIELSRELDSLIVKYYCQGKLLDNY